MQIIIIVIIIIWRMPEMVAPRALDSCRRPEGS